MKTHTHHALIVRRIISQVMKTLNDSPRIIRVFGCCELPAKQQLMLLMERAVGGTVAALLEDKRRPLSEQQKGLVSGLQVQ